MSEGGPSPEPCLWIVVPCYNEEQVLPVTIQRIAGLMGQMMAEGLIAPDSRAVYVDDCSADGTWAVISRAAASPLNGGLRLAENSGHQNALMAGMETAAGTAGVDAVVTIDADLQDDISAIPCMVSLYRQGSDVVYGVRSDRTADTLMKRLTAHAFYRVMSWLGAPIIHDHADCRLMSSRAIRRLSCYNGRRLFLRGIIPQMGFPSAQVSYSRLKREAGETKYTLWRMLKLAADGIASVYTGKFGDAPAAIKRYDIVETII